MCLAQHLGALVGNALTEEVRDFRGGDEVACGADFHAPGTVVAQSRRIERQTHELLEGDDAPRSHTRAAFFWGCGPTVIATYAVAVARRLGDPSPDQCRHRLRMSALFGRKGRQD